MGLFDTIKGLASQAAPYIPGGTTAMAIASQVAPVAQGVITKVQSRVAKAMQNRAMTVSQPAAARRARNTVRAVKPPLVTRVQQADEGRNEVARIAALQPRAPHVVPLLGNEIAHMGGQVRKLVEDLVDQGAMATGDWKTDVTNGTLMVNGQKVDLTSGVVALSIAKSLEMRAPAAAGSAGTGGGGLLERLANAGGGPSVPLLAFRSLRRTGADPEPRRPGDMCGFVIASGQVLPQDSAGPSWPANTVVFEGVAPRFVPNFETAVTVAGTVWAWTRTEWYLKALALVPETVKNLFNKGSNLGDFRLGWGE